MIIISVPALIFGVIARSLVYIKNDFLQSCSEFKKIWKNGIPD